jgi:hypothetical protein
MENLYFEITLEYLFGMPYADILEGTIQAGAREADLLQMGHRLYLDLARMQRSEIAEISVPLRYPRPGEYASAA